MSETASQNSKRTSKKSGLFDSPLNFFLLFYPDYIMSSFYAAAIAMVENSEGEILMVQEGKDHIKGKWDFPGGGWEDGESIIECVKREILEETGYKIEVNGFSGAYKQLSQRDSEEVIVFVFEADVIERKFENPVENEEILDTKFFSIEEIEQLELRMDNRQKVLKNYQEGKICPTKLLWDELNLLE
jgi:8-oxo-dGTP pyrophosphatase MutT (NUDIX family)